MSTVKSKQKNNEERQLVQLFSSLGSADRNSLISFAEFLSVKSNDSDNLSSKQISDSLNVSQRPEDENVIKAIKRLSESYPMIEKDKLLHQISDLMTAHMMKGKSAKLVIDELEVLFLEEYQNIIK